MIFVVVILCQLVVGAPILKSHLDGNDIETPSISQELFEQSPNTDEITFNFVKNRIYKKFSNATNKIALPTFDLPEFDLPTFDLPTFAFNSSTFDSNKVHEFITDNLDLFIKIGIIILVLFIIYCSSYIVGGIIHLLGFTANGIVRGSQAALFMASYGGKIVSGSLVSLLQSVGALRVRGFGGLLKLLFGLLALFFRFICCC